MSTVLATAFALLSIGVAFGTFHLGYRCGKAVRRLLSDHELQIGLTRVMLESGFCAHQHPIEGDRCMYRSDHGGPHQWACNLSAARGPICRLPRGHLGICERAA